MQNDFYDWKLFAWSVDFVRCIEEMPLWRRLLIRLLLGRYAGREYVGLVEHLEDQQEGQTKWGYGIENTTYNQEVFGWLRNI